MPYGGHRGRGQRVRRRRPRCRVRHRARTALAHRLPSVAGLPHVVAPLPTTIPANIHPAAGPRLAAALDDQKHRGVLLSLCGYAAPGKSPTDLLAALARSQRAGRS